MNRIFRHSVVYLAGLILGALYTIIPLYVSIPIIIIVFLVMEWGMGNEKK